MLNFASVIIFFLIEVQTKVRFLLAENNLSSVDTALQTRGYIRLAYTHIKPNEK